MTDAQQFEAIVAQLEDMVAQRLLRVSYERRLIAEDWVTKFFESLQGSADAFALLTSTLSSRQSPIYRQLIGLVSDPILSAAPASPPRIVPYPS
jgi:hypothetical protein